MNRIGDKDPLDAWDESDPLETKLRVLEHLVELDHVSNGQRDEALRLLLKLYRIRGLLAERMDQVRLILESI